MSVYAGRRRLLMPIGLLMRHKSIETTLKYYVSQNADDMTEELWRAYEPAAPKRAAKGVGNTSGNSRAKSG